MEIKVLEEKGFKPKNPVDREPPLQLHPKHFDKWITYFIP